MVSIFLCILIELGIKVVKKHYSFRVTSFIYVTVTNLYNTIVKNLINNLLRIST